MSARAIACSFPWRERPPTSTCSLRAPVTCTRTSSSPGRRGTFSPSAGSTPKPPPRGETSGNVTFVARMPGPPFSVPPDEVRDLFGRHFRIISLDRSEMPVGPRFTEAGIPFGEEHTLLLERLDEGEAASYL